MRSLACSSGAWRRDVLSARGLCRLAALAACVLAAPTAAEVLRVTSTDDAGSGTLREAITIAESNGEADVVLFDIGDGETIALSSELPAIDTDLAVCGSGQTVSGGESVRIFRVDGGQVLVSGLTLADARNVGDLGGDGGQAAVPGSGGGGGAGLGGAVLVRGGTVRLQGMFFENNLAEGGMGGDFGAISGAGSGSGGGGGGAGGGLGGAGVGGGASGSPGEDLNGWGGGGAGGDVTGPAHDGGSGGDFAGGGGGSAGAFGDGGQGGFGGGGGGSGLDPTFPCASLGLGGTHGGAGGPCGGGGGGAGLGGAIFVDAGSLVLTDSSFTGNSVLGGGGGAGPIPAEISEDGVAGEGVAHAIYNRNGTVDTGNVAYDNTDNHLFGPVGAMATTPQTGLSVTKSDGLATATPGQAITYTLTVANAGPDDAPFAVVTDIFPVVLQSVSWTCTADVGASCPAMGTGNLDVMVNLPAGTEVVFTIDATISAGFAGTLSNTATVAHCGVTDGGGENSATDTTEVAPSPASVSATKTAAGTFLPGGTVTYTVVLANAGPAAQLDNPGAEFTDVLPQELALVSAVATSGTASADSGTNTVTWNGSIPPAGSVTITITATLLDVAAGTTVINQGMVAFDADGDGTNESSVPSDDPEPPGVEDATTFVVGAVGAAAEVPALSAIGVLLLLALLAGSGVLLLRRS